VVLSEPGAIDEDWSQTVRYTPVKMYSDFTDDLTGFLCVEALRRCQGSRIEAAELLNTSRDAFYRYLRPLKIQS
jgi:DNA-binding NtrC family response regulator